MSLAALNFPFPAVPTASRTLVIPMVIFIYLVRCKICIPSSSCLQKRSRKIDFLYTLRLKNNFKVMPFGRKNVPVFYTAMIQFLRDEWILLCQEIKHIIVITNSPSYIVCDDRIIIRDIFLLSNHVSTILHYFSCVARAFTKYRLSFK